MIALFFLPPGPPRPVWTPAALLWHDGTVRFYIIEAFIQGRALGDLQNVDPGWSDRWPLIGTLIASPLWYLGSIVKSPSFWLARYNWFLLAAGLLAIWLLLRPRMDRAVLRTFLVLLVTGSLFASHVSAYITFEPFTAVLVTVGVLAVVTGRGWFGWPLIVLGVANMPAALGGCALAVLVHAVVTRRLRYLVVPVAALALILLDNKVRTGQWTPAPYAALDRGFNNGTPYSGLPSFSYPFLFGILALTLSFGKGLVFFTPGLFVPARQALQRVGAEVWSAYRLLVAFVLGLVLVYARWWGWDGGFFWGPRFFLIATVPAALVVAVRLHQRQEHIRGVLLNLGLVVLGGWIAISGAAFGMDNLTRCEEGPNTLNYQCDFVPTLSPLWHPFGQDLNPAPHSPGFIVLVVLAVVRLALPSLVTLVRLIRAREPAARARQWLAPAGWQL